jgi:hypothetical protein
MRCHAILIVAISFYALAGNGEALDWPIFLDSVYKPIGNSYAGYQCYGDPCSPFLHTGIDIMAPPGVPVYAVKSGYVKAILTTSADTHWRVVIGDLAGTAECDAWMYAHVDYLSIVMNAGLHVGDWVEEGRYIGDVVNWTINDFNHLHFSKIRYGGDAAQWENNWVDWVFIANPLDEFDATADSIAPVFENAHGDSLLALCRNQFSIYFAPGETVSGDVDIVCRVYDRINSQTYKVVPYSVEYNFDQGPAGPWIPGICFTNVIGTYNDLPSLTPVIYRDDQICDSKGDYGIQQCYLNITNSDGDSVLELSDRPFSWRTADFTNGEHTIYVCARDKGGNETIDSMTVTVANYFSLSGIIQLADEVPQPQAGTIVTVVETGQSDTTDEAGSFVFPAIGGGSQVIRASRTGFLAVDTVMMMIQNQVLEMSLVPGGYVAGDANADGIVNVGDVVYLINFVFKLGSPPFPYSAGDANCDYQANVADAVYLINHIFKGGDPPQEGCGEE